MAEVIGLKKAAQQIKLDDSPDSPVFTLVLAGEQLGQKMTDMLVYAEEYLRANENLQEAVKDGDLDKALAAQVELAEIYEGMVNTMLGANAWDEIVNWISGGASISVGDLVALLSPLIQYLIRTLNDTLGVTRRQAHERYVEADNAADAI